MTTSSPVNAANIDIINEQIIILNAQNKYDGYKGRIFNPCFSKCGYKNSKAKLYGLFERLHRASHGGIIEIKHKTMAAQLDCHIKTTQRGVLDLEADGILIVLRGWKNSYIFVPPDRQLEDMKARIEAIILEAEKDKSWGQNVPKIGTKCPQDTLINNKRYIQSTAEQVEEPEPDLPPEQVEEPVSKKQPAAKLFYNNQIKYLGYFIDSIRDSCEKMEAMARAKKNYRFSPYQFVGWAIKEKFHVGAIMDVMQKVITYNYDYIFEDGIDSFGWLRGALKTQGCICNAYDSEQFNTVLKREERDFCDKMKREGIVF